MYLRVFFKQEVLRVLAELNVSEITRIVCARITTHVTVFWKTSHLHTKTEFHLLPVHDRHTHALSRNSKY